MPLEHPSAKMASIFRLRSFSKSATSFMVMTLSAWCQDDYSVDLVRMASTSVNLHFLHIRPATQGLCWPTSPCQSCLLWQCNAVAYRP